MIYIGPRARSDLSKTHVLLLPLYHKANKKAQAVNYTVIKHSGHLRTRGTCRKYEPQANVYIATMRGCVYERELSSAFFKTPAVKTFVCGLDQLKTK